MKNTYKILKWQTEKLDMLHLVYVNHHNHHHNNNATHYTIIAIRYNFTPSTIIS